MEGVRGKGSRNLPLNSRDGLLETYFHRTVAPSVSDLSQKPLATDYMFRKDILCCRSYSKGLFCCTAFRERKSAISKCALAKFSERSRNFLREDTHTNGVFYCLLVTPTCVIYVRDATWQPIV
jgi:hypothetical protein